MNPILFTLPTIIYKSIILSIALIFIIYYIKSCIWAKKKHYKLNFLFHLSSNIIIILLLYLRELFTKEYLFISSYSFFVFVGYISLGTIYYLLCKNSNLNYPNLIFNLIMGSFFALLGGKVFSYLFFNTAGKSGFMFYGSLIFFIIAFCLSLFKDKQKILAHLNVLSIGICLGHFFGRLGCFSAGCCFGKINEVYGMSFCKNSVVYNYQLQNNLLNDTLQSLKVYPVQLYESCFLFLLFIVLLYLFYKKKHIYNLAIYCISYGIIRFLLEFLRQEHILFSSNQIIALIQVIIGIFIVLYQTKRKAKSLA